MQNIKNDTTLGNKLLKLMLKILISAISGFFAGNAFYPSHFFGKFLGWDINLGILGFIAPIFFILIVLSARRIWSAIIYSMVFGFMYYLNVMAWIAGVTTLGLILTGIIYTVTFWIMLGAMFHLFKRYLGTLAPLMIASGWVGYEFLLSWFWARTPWAFMGYNAFWDFPLIQFADVFGIWGVTFVIIFFSSGIACSVHAFSSFHTQKAEIARIEAIKWRRILVVSVSVFALAHIYGIVRLWTLPTPDEETLTVALTQPSIPQGLRNERNGTGSSASVIDKRQTNIFKYLAMTSEKAGVFEFNSPDLDGTLPDIATTDKITIIRLTDKPIDLVVDSETSFNYKLESYVNEGRKYSRYKQVSNYVRIAKQNAWYLQISALEKAKNLDKEFPEDLSTGRNCSHLYSPEGKILQTYQKIELVPFGETVPFFKYTSFVYDVLHQAVGRAQQFEPGQTFEIFEFPQDDENKKPVKYGVAICFETNFPYVNREIVKKGAEFIIVHSNDGWFLDTYEPEQIWLQTQVRAIENRVGYLRAVNSGITGVCDQTGKMIAQLEKNGNTRGVAGALVVEAPRGSGKSPYHFFGDILAHICTLLSLTMLVILSILAIFKRK